MQQFRNDDRQDHPLRNMSAAEFMALGSNAVVYVKQMRGEDVSRLLPQAGPVEDADYHLVISADGHPLMIADNAESLAEWLSGRNVGIVTVH